MNRIGNLIPILFLFVFGVQTTYAQTAKCKPKNRANKNKTWAVADIRLSQTTWMKGDTTITIAGDTIKIKKDDVLLSTFHVRYNIHIKDSILIERYPDGKIKRVDSLVPQHVPNADNMYYGIFRGRAVYSHRYYPSGIPQKSVYYNRAGRDSLKKNWYPNGVLQECSWSYPSGEDSVIYKWNQEGILQHIKRPLETLEYYPNGLLKSHTSDTTIEQKRIKCVRAYYPTGILESVTYYHYTVPCHTWLYYTQQGVLAQTVKQTPVSKLPPYRDGVAEILEPAVFTYVEQMSEFPGGETSFKKYLVEKLYPAICESRYPLSGIYTVKFAINADITIKFLSLTGENHTAILEPVKTVIQQMPKWKPGKRNGKPITTVFEVELKLSSVK